ncbi:MAG: cytochrome c [Planctomycetota bacterium]
MKNPITELIKDMYLPRPPVWLVYILIIAVVASWVPLSLVFLSRSSTSTNPPVHFFQDMFVQPRYNAQGVTAVFADARAQRPPVAGTVAFGSYDTIHLRRGYRVDDAGAPVTRTEGSGDTAVVITEYVDGYPEGLTVDESFLKRGQLKYGIYCYPCHGHDGRGNGPINQRATELSEALTNGSGTQWVAASNIMLPQYWQAETIAESGEPQSYPNGKMFNTITYGIRNMAGYGSQIEPADRWAIVAYIRAMQLAQGAEVIADAEPQPDAEPAATDEPQANAQ